MSQYTDLIAGILSWTNRPDLQVEMDTGIRNAVRTAHRAGKFARDLVTVNLTEQVVQQIQEVDFSTTPFVRFRQVATVRPTEREQEYLPVEVLDLFDPDGYARTNVFYVIGNKINIRAEVPVDKITINYYQRPDVGTDLTLLNDWIIDEYQDLIILWAAATVLAAAGEQEVKTRVETLAKLEYQNLVSDALQSAGR